MEPDGTHTRPASGTGASVALEPGIHVVVEGDAEVVGVAVLAAGRLGVELDAPVAVVRHEDGLHDAAAPTHHAPRSIHLRLVAPDALELPTGGRGREQGFVLTVARDRVDLVATTPTGLAHGVAGLVRMASASRTRADRVERRPPRLPLVTVRDQPWLDWRGLAVDLATEPLGIEGLRVVLSHMSALRLGVLRLPATEAASLHGAGYAELSAAATASRVELVPGVGASADALAVGELVASTRARRVDIGGRTEHPLTVRGRAVAARSAGAAVLADQAAAHALVDVPDVVLVVRDVTAADDVAAVRRAVASGARVVLAVARQPSEHPMLEAAVAVDRAAAALDLPPHALIGVEAVPVLPSPPPLAPHSETGRAGALLPWMSAIAEVGWTPPATAAVETPTTVRAAG